MGAVRRGAADTFRALLPIPSSAFGPSRGAAAKSGGRRECTSGQTKAYSDSDARPPAYSASHRRTKGYIRRDRCGRLEFARGHVPAGELQLDGSTKRSDVPG